MTVMDVAKPKRRTWQVRQVKSIQNPEALHALGRQQFRSVAAITETPDAAAMVRVMHAIVNDEILIDHETKLRVMSFIQNHHLS